MQRNNRARLRREAHALSASRWCQLHEANMVINVVEDGVVGDCF